MPYRLPYLDRTLHPRTCHLYYYLLPILPRGTQDSAMFYPIGLWRTILPVLCVGWDRPHGTRPMLPTDPTRTCHAQPPCHHGGIGPAAVPPTHQAWLLPSNWHLPSPAYPTHCQPAMCASYPGRFTATPACPGWDLAPACPGVGPPPGAEELLPAIAFKIAACHPHPYCRWFLFPASIPYPDYTHPIGGIATDSPGSYPTDGRTCGQFCIAVCAGQNI